MKKAQKSHSFTKRVKITSLLLWISFFWYVFWEDVVSQIIPAQTATGTGSNNSIVEITTNDADYINKGNNSTVIGNYFNGYYYDSIYGFFQLDKLKATGENVRIVGSTSACGTGYGYKLWGYAYSNYFGFMDFNYNSSIFVYYCESDKKLHGYAYNEDLGFQNFEGIGFEIIPSVSTVAEVSGTGVFVNDTTELTTIQTFTGSTSNFDYNSILWDTANLDATQESIFYIIK